MTTNRSGSGFVLSVPVVFASGFIALYVLSAASPSLWSYVFVALISWVIADIISFFTFPRGGDGRARDTHGRFIRFSSAYLTTMIMIIVASWVGTTFSEAIVEAFKSYPLGYLYASLAVPVVVLLDVLWRIR